MASFDASVIGGIGDNQVDVAGSQGKALTLADMYTTQAHNKMALASEKRDAEDMTYAKQILEKGDLSNLEGQNAAVAAITKRNPNLGMKLAAGFSGSRQDQNAETMQQFQILNARHEVLSSAVAPLKDKHDDLYAQLKKANPNADPMEIERQVDQAMRPDMFQTIQNLREQKLPNGQPLLQDTDLKWAAEQFKDGYNPKAVDQLVMHSKEQREIAAAKLKANEDKRKDEREERADKRLDLSTKIEDRNSRTAAQMENHRERQDALADRKVKIQEAKADASKANFAGPAGDLMAALAERGVSLPAGFRSKEQQVALIGGLLARNQGMTPDQIAEKIESGQLAFGNAKVEGRKAAGIAGGISYAEHELEQTIPLVRQAAEKLPRGQFIPFNKIREMGEKAFSDPDLAEYSMYMTSLSNAYDLLAARGGTDAEKRKHNREQFNTAQSIPALEATLRAVQQEASASGRAANESMRDAANRNMSTGGPTEARTGAGGAGMAPTQILRFDAQGNPVP